VSGVSPSPVTEPSVPPTSPTASAPAAPPTSEATSGTVIAEPEPETTDVVVTTPREVASVRSSTIPVGSIVIAVLVIIAAVVAALVVRRRPEAGRVTPRRVEGAPHAAHAETLEFLTELGEALLQAGDSVGHVEGALRTVARVHGVDHLGVLVLPSSLVLSIPHADSVTAEVRTTRAGALRLDQIDDVIHLMRAAEGGDLTVAEGRRELARIRSGPSPISPQAQLVAHVVLSAGLALVLSGGLLEVCVAAVLGLVVGGLRLVTASQRPTQQAFWPLVAAFVVSTASFATARLFTDLATFPALVAPLITFLPGVLMTMGVLELATGHTVAGSSRLAAGSMRLILLALGIVAGAQLVGIPAGHPRAGIDGWPAAVLPWVGVGLFGLGASSFHGSRRRTLPWILLVMYVAYAGQVIGGLFFGTALSAFFGAVAMTPAALFASHRPSGPTPLVTFLPGFWLLVPGALGLEGVTRLIGEGSSSTGVLVATLTSMIGISLGLLLGLILSGADPDRPWSVAASHQILLSIRRRPAP